MEPAAIECPGCHQTTETKVRPGTELTCPSCAHTFRRPLPRTGRAFECPACGAEQHTGVAPGRRAHCKACGEEVRVPMRALGAGTRVACPACEAEQETRTPPGKHTHCAACKAEFRVPLPDPQAPHEAPAKPPPPHLRLAGSESVAPRTTIAGRPSLLVSAFLIAAAVALVVHRSGDGELRIPHIAIGLFVLGVAGLVTAVRRR